MKSTAPGHIDMNGPVPRHVAIIMDGNGRWARRRGLPRKAGHENGMSAVRTTIQASVDAGIEILTLFAFSTDNWNRPSEEVSALMSLLRVYAERERAELVDKGVEVARDRFAREDAAFGARRGRPHRERHGRRHDPETEPDDLVRWPGRHRYRGSPIGEEGRRG